MLYICLQTCQKKIDLTVKHNSMHILYLKGIKLELSLILLVQLMHMRPSSEKSIKTFESFERSLAGEK